MARAIGNLIGNALRYAGGADGAVARDDGCVTVTVRDRGQGIDPAILGAVPKPFSGARPAAMPGPAAAGWRRGSRCPPQISASMRTVIRPCEHRSTRALTP